MKNKNKKHYTDFLFYCYSPNLNNYIQQHGYKPIKEGRHNVTKRIFWVYFRGGDFDVILNQWTENKNKNKLKN